MFISDKNSFGSWKKVKWTEIDFILILISSECDHCKRLYVNFTSASEMYRVLGIFFFFWIAHRMIAYRPGLYSKMMQHIRQKHDELYFPELHQR